MKEVEFKRPPIDGAGPSLDIAQLVRSQADRERAAFNGASIVPVYENIYLRRVTEDPDTQDRYEIFTQIDQHGDATVLAQKWNAATGQYEEVRLGGYKRDHSFKNLGQDKVNQVPYKIKDNSTGKEWRTKITDWGVTGINPSEYSSTPSAAAELAWAFQQRLDMAYEIDENGNITNGPGIGRPMPQPVTPPWQAYQRPPDSPDIQAQQPGQAPDTQGAQPPTQEPPKDDVQKQLTAMQEQLDGMLDVITAPSKPDQTQEKILAALEQNRLTTEALAKTLTEFPAIMAGIFVEAMKQHDEAAKEGRRQDQEAFLEAMTKIVVAARLGSVQSEPNTTATAPEPVPAMPDKSDEILRAIGALTEDFENDKKARPQEIEQIVSQTLEAQTTVRNLEIAALISKVDLDRKDATTGEIRQFDSARGEQIREMQENIAYLEGGISNLEGLLNQILSNQEAQAAAVESVGVSQDSTQLSDDELADAPDGMDPEDNDLLADEEDAAMDAGDMGSAAGDSGTTPRPWPEAEDIPEGASAASTTEAGSDGADQVAEEHGDIPLGTILLGSMLPHGGEIVLDDEERELTHTGTLQTDEVSREAAGQARDVTPSGKNTRVNTDLRDATPVEARPVATVDERESVAEATAVVVLDRPSNGTDGNGVHAQTIPFDQDAPGSPVWVNGAPQLEVLDASLPDWATKNGGDPSGGEDDPFRRVTPRAPIGSNGGYLSSHDLFNGSGLSAVPEATATEELDSIQEVDRPVGAPVVEGSEIRTGEITASEEINVRLKVLERYGRTKKNRVDAEKAQQLFDEVALDGSMNPRVEQVVDELSSTSEYPVDNIIRGIPFELGGLLTTSKRVALRRHGNNLEAARADLVGYLRGKAEGTGNYTDEELEELLGKI